MKRAVAAGLALALGLALGGCVVFPYGPYWKPEVVTAGVSVDYRQAWCGEQVGPITKARVALADGTRVELRVEDKPAPYVFVVLSPGPTPIELGPTQSFAPASGRAAAVTVPTALRRSIYANGKYDIRRDGPLRITADERAALSLEVPIPEGLGDFVYTLPELHTPSGVQRLQVRFERRRFDGGVQPFNC